MRDLPETPFTEVDARCETCGTTSTFPIFRGNPATLECPHGCSGAFTIVRIDSVRYVPHERRHIPIPPEELPT